MTSVFISGTSRGIGLELVKQFLKHDNPPKNIIAACRSPEKAIELNELARRNSNIHVLQLDVTNMETFPGVAKKVEEIVGDGGLNLMINNAGITTVSGKIHNFKDVKPEDFIHVFTTNVVGPMFLTQALLPIIKKAADANKEAPVGISRAAILNMGSFLGSVKLNQGGHWAYRESKAALNQSTRSLAHELQASGIIVTVLHPGHVRTDMGGQEGLLDVEQSVSGLIKVIYGLKESNHNKFIRWDGKELEW